MGKASPCSPRRPPRRRLALQTGSLAVPRLNALRTLRTRETVISVINFDYVLQVVRLCAKSREDVSSPSEHLTLHYQVLPFVAFMEINLSMNVTDAYVKSCRLGTLIPLKRVNCTSYSNSKMKKVIHV